MTLKTCTAKTCARCEQEKPTTEFTKFRGGYFQSYCKACYREINRLKREEKLANRIETYLF